ncbi:MAG: hypothetical protein IJ347_10355, partial [Faecalibacterium sp.]|nr:hypothetical protein [Faecalibacterium sp.]
MARYALLIAALVGFLVTLAAVALLLPALAQLRARHPETASQSPAWQVKSRAVPTLGGVCVIVGTLAGVVLASAGVRTLEPLLTDLGQSARGTMATTAALGFALIGLADDLCRMLRKNGRGLFWALKLALQSVVISLFFTALHLSGGLNTAFWLPGLGYWQPAGWWYYLFSFGLMLWLVNSAELLADTDGLCPCVGCVIMAGCIAVVG